MVKKNEVDLTVSQLINDLGNGHTWLTKDDEGYGSIQAKYKASDIEIKTIQKHPKLVGIEPSITILRVIDDLKDENSAATVQLPNTKVPTSSGANKQIQQPVVPVVSPAANLGTIKTTAASNATESEDSFDNL